MAGTARVLLGTCQVLPDNAKYLSQVRKYGGLEKSPMAYMEYLKKSNEYLEQALQYLMISVIVQAKRRRGKPIEPCEGGQSARMAQVT